MRSSDGSRCINAGMIAPAKISPPPPLQGRPPSHAQGMGPIHGPRSEAARRGSSPSSPTWRRLPPRGEPANRRKNEGGKGKEERKRERRKRRKFRGHRRRCVELARRLSVNGPRVPPKFEFLQKHIYGFKPLAYSPRAIFHWLRRAAQKRGGGCNTRTSREVTHPSTTLAQARLTAEF